MAGRKPKPTRLKIITGNPGKRKLPENEPMPDVATPEPLPGISDAARHYWERIAPQLIAPGILTNVDKEALTLLCDTLAIYHEANDKLCSTSLIAQNREGGLIQNPYLRIANQSLQNAIKLMTEFGMTPSSRSRVQVAQKDTKTDDDWARFE